MKMEAELNVADSLCDYKKCMLHIVSITMMGTGRSKKLSRNDVYDNAFKFLETVNPSLLDMLEFALHVGISMDCLEDAVGLYNLEKCWNCDEIKS